MGCTFPKKQRPPGLRVPLLSAVQTAASAAAATAQFLSLLVQHCYPFLGLLSVCHRRASAPAGTEEGCFERASRFIHRSRTDKLKCIGGAVWCCGDVTPPGPDAAVYTKLNKCAPIRPPAGRFTSFGRLYPWRVSPQYLPLDVVVGVVHVIEVEEQGVPTGQQQELVQVVKLGSANGMGQHVPALKVHRRFDSSTGSNDYLSNVLFSY